MKKILELRLIIGVVIAVSKLTYCISSTPRTKEDFLPNHDYFLPYMFRLRRNYTRSLTRETPLCVSNFETECKTKPHSFTHFNKIVYSVLCQNITKTKDKYCSNCQHQKGTVCPKLCNIIFAYLQQVNLNDTEDSFVFKETVLEDVPFCCSVTIPFLETFGHGNGSIILSVFDSMPKWCQTGFYVVLFLDIILSFMIAVVNGGMILIGAKYSFTRFSGG